MQAHKIFFVVILVIGLIGMVRSNDPVKAGELFFMHVNVVNDGTEDLDDLNVKLIFYDLDLLLQSNTFDLDDDDKTGKLLFWEVPYNTEPGDYWVRIIVSNDDVRKVRHRIVTIV